MTGFYIRGEMLLRMGNETLTLTNANHLQAKVLTTRLERGAAEAGRLIFTVPGDRTAQVKTCQFSIEVSCLDFQKTPSSAVFRPDPKPLDGIKMYPGELLQKGATQPEAVSFTQPALPPASGRPTDN